MHAYSVPRRQVPPPIPSARAANDGGPSATPIYDALYAEYVKTFRSLPGDRSGEEELGFTAFGTRHPAAYPGSFSSSVSSSYSAYSAGASSARHGTGQQSQWQRVGQLGTMTHVPAALPPGTGGN
ncbi:hypothetical protein [Streptomyces sp. NPDC058739]|uniref:hypothetical protein n=1 Tax=Streptomyces sp. NPDC058739 TaxID=3346618 RepID=UPI0036849FD8